MTEESREVVWPFEEAQTGKDTGDTGSGREASAQRGAITCSGCTAKWTGLGRAHCSSCHMTYTGISAFEQHRGAISEGAPRGFCHDPVSLGMVEREPNLWGSPAMTREQIEKAWPKKSEVVS